jgi:CheY-like chemotaxis protein
MTNGLLIVLYALLLRILILGEEPLLNVIIKGFLFVWLIIGATGALLQKEWGRKLSLGGCAAGILIALHHMYFMIQAVEDIALALIVLWGGLLKFYSVPQFKVMYQKGFKTPNWRILLIDDDRLFRKEMLRHFLSEGVFPFMEDRGEKGIRLAKRYKPDLIILDESLPDIKGREVCIRLKEDSATKEIPVVFMIDQEPVEDIKSKMEAGAIAYFHKPVVFSELFRELKKILGE